MGKINDHSIDVIVMDTLLTILPLWGIYSIPNLWWGILIKVILSVVILKILQNIWFHEIYKEASKHGYDVGVLSNLLLFSGIYFFFTHWVSYVFAVLFVFILSANRRILQKYKYND